MAALHSAGVVIWTLRDGLVDLISNTFLELLVTHQRTTANDFRERCRRGRADAARRREIAAGSTNPELPANDRLAAMEWRIAHHRDPVGRYLTLASLITDLGHQSDEDGTHYAVDCSVNILSQATWHQARMLVDALGNAIEFEDDIYDGWGLAAAVGEVVLLKDRSERLRAIRALVECGIEDLPFEWGRETALFLKKQRLAAVGQVNV